jgi:hypothetical protein
LTSRKFRSNSGWPWRHSIWRAGFPIFMCPYQKPVARLMGPMGPSPNVLLISFSLSLRASADSKNTEPGDSMCEALKAITAKAGNDARSPGAKGIGHSEVLRLVFARYGDARSRPYCQSSRDHSSWSNACIWLQASLDFRMGKVVKLWTFARPWHTSRLNPARPLGICMPTPIPK